MVAYTRNELLEYQRGAGVPSAHTQDEIGTIAVAREPE